jgi:WD40 repeat protein
LVVAAGTYDGVLAGWELEEDDDAGNDDGSSRRSSSNRNSRLKIRFASPIHNGSVRSLALNSAPFRSAKKDDRRNSQSSGNEREVGRQVLGPGLLVSTGFDYVLRLHDFSRRATGSGEVRTPAEFGTPLVAALAPPVRATHCLVGFASGKVLIYSLKDWSVQHVLPGHASAGAGASSSSSSSSSCGVSSLSVHPSGKLALSGGTSDGRLMLWDLTRGRLAHATKVATASTKAARKRNDEPIASIAWGRRGSGLVAEEEEGQVEGGEVYAYCFGSHVTVRDVGTGRDLLDVELPSRVNQICLLSNEFGLFVVAACNDGSLPVLAVEEPQHEKDGSGNGNGGGVRRAIMAIEPVDTTDRESHTAGEERFKCVQSVSPYHVVTANSAGVVSLMSLAGAIRMLQSPGDDDDDDGNDGDSSDGDVEPPSKTSQDESDSEEEEELAVDIIDSVQLGTGARITCLAAWATVSSHNEDRSKTDRQDPGLNAQQTVQDDAQRKAPRASNDLQAKRRRAEVELDATALDKARKLVSQAKKIQKRKQKKQRGGE